MEARALRRRLLWTVLVAVAAFFFVPTLPALAADDYPYADGDSSELDERGFYYRHCTSFVAWRMSQRGEFHNYMQGGHWWHARNWAANAEQLGFTVDETPAPGAIAHWNAGEQGADDLGHVAFVESVHTDGSVTVEEYNGTNSLGYSRRGPTRAPRYIHVYDDSAPDPAPAVPVDAPSEPVPVEPVNLEVAAPRASVVAKTPDVEGVLVSPAEDSPLHSGDTLTVAAVFSDDPRVSEVRFVATDGGYEWEPIGTAGTPEGGRYSIEWAVAYPAGSRISLSAQALDDEGVLVGESVRGLEDLKVIPQRFVGVGRGQHREDSPAPELLADADSAVGRSEDNRGGVVPLMVPALILLGSGVSIRRSAKFGAARGRAGPQ